MNSKRHYGGQNNNYTLSYETKQRRYGIQEFCSGDKLGSHIRRGRDIRWLYPNNQHKLLHE